MSGGGGSQTTRTEQVLSPEQAAAINQRMAIFNAALRGLGMNWNARTAQNPAQSFMNQWNPQQAAPVVAPMPQPMPQQPAGPAMPPQQLNEPYGAP